jgi:mono/diheme cytochrome c family protein
MKALLIGLSIFVWCVAGTAFTASAQSAEQLAKGEALYSDFCSACHGPYGRGDGPISDDLAVRPPDMTNAALLGGRSDDEIMTNLKGSPGQSHTPMVMANVLKEDSLRDALAYMRTLSVSGKQVSVLAGRDLYRTFCLVCHGESGNGQGPAAVNLPGNKPRDFTSSEFVIEGREDAVYEVIRTGAASSFHGSEYMLEWGTKLSPQQMKDVIEYLKTFQPVKP